MRLTLRSMGGINTRALIGKRLTIAEREHDPLQVSLWLKVPAGDELLLWVTQRDILVKPPREAT